MARTNTTPEQWAEAKALWESDTKISYADIGNSLGISKQAVAKKANADRWQKRMDLPKVVKQAHREADKAMIESTLPLATFAVNGGKEAAKVDGQSQFSEGGRSPAVEHVVADEVDGREMTPVERADAAALAVRVELTKRHRKEWIAPLNLAYEAARTKNGDLAKTAKTISEALKIIQEGERKAWGMDVNDKEPGQVVIIDRG